MYISFSICKKLYCLELYCQNAVNCLQILACTYKLNFAYAGKCKEQELPDRADMQAACYAQLWMGSDAHIVYMPLRIFTIAYMEYVLLEHYHVIVC